MYCHEYVIDSHKQDTIEHIHYHKEGSVYKELLARIPNFVGSTSFPLIRTKCVADAGGFDELMQSVQDWDLWLRLSKITEFACVDEPLVNYYAHCQEHIGGNKFRVLRGMERLFLKNEAAISADKSVCWLWLYWLVPMYKNCGEYRNMFHSWFRALRIKPFRIVGNIYMICRGFVPLGSVKRWLYIHNKTLYEFVRKVYRQIKSKILHIDEEIL